MCTELFLGRFTELYVFKALHNFRILDQMFFSYFRTRVFGLLSNLSRLSDFSFVLFGSFHFRKSPRQIFQFLLRWLLLLLRPHFLGLWPKSYENDYEWCFHATYYNHLMFGCNLQLGMHGSWASHINSAMTWDRIHEFLFSSLKCTNGPNNLVLYHTRLERLASDKHQFFGLIRKLRRK